MTEGSGRLVLVRAPSLIAAHLTTLDQLHVVGADRHGVLNNVRRLVNRRFFLGGIILAIVGMWPGLLVGVGIAVYMARANRYYRRDHKRQPIATLFPSVSC